MKQLCTLLLLLCCATKSNAQFCDTANDFSTKPVPTLLNPRVAYNRFYYHLILNNPPEIKTGIEPRSHIHTSSKLIMIEQVDAGNMPTGAALTNGQILRFT